MMRIVCFVGLKILEIIVFLFVCEGINILVNFFKNSETLEWIFMLFVTVSLGAVLIFIFSKFLVEIVRANWGWSKEVELYLREKIKFLSGKKQNG